MINQNDKSSWQCIEMTTVLKATSGTYFINFFTKAYIASRSKLQCSSLSVTSTLVWYFQARREPTLRVGSQTCLQILDQGGSDWQSLTNTLSSYDTELITVVIAAVS